MKEQQYQQQHTYEEHYTLTAIHKLNNNQFPFIAYNTHTNKLHTITKITYLEAIAHSSHPWGLYQSEDNISFSPDLPFWILPAPSATKPEIAPATATTATTATNKPTK
jgi:hypothetical protein